jgi:tetratricopeptide (TPR) repeat protein
MTGNTREKAQGIISLITILFLVWGINVFALQNEDQEVQPAGEQKISTLSDYLYSKDLERYKQIQAVTDNQKKIDQLTAYLKERPISKLLFNAVTDYMASASRIAGNNYDRLISMAETLWELVPTDQEIAAEAKFIPVGLEDFKKQHLLPARSLILKQIAAAYYQKQNFAKAAEYAERAYATTPDIQMAQLLFDSYEQLKNEDKVVAYGKKILDKVPMRERQGYVTALKLADIYIKKQDANAAIQMFTKIMDVYGNSVPPNIPEAEWNKTRIFAYSLMARDAYSKSNYEKAEKLFQTVLSFDSQLDEPYYYLGMCRWKSKDQQAAIVYFARCAVLNKSYAERANKYLQELYKATYPNKPEGLQDVINQAKKDLGIV